MRRRSLLVLGSAVFVLAATGALTTAWLTRNALGERLAVGYLRSRGVPAVLKLTRLDAQRVEGSLTLGPVGRPTLSVAHFVAEFANTPPFALPRLRRLRLSQPRLTVSFDGKRLDFGSLQPLIDDAAKAPKTAAPAPDIAVSDGEIEVATPYGQVLIHGNADVIAGRIRLATFTLSPTQLRSPTAAFDKLEGHLTVTAAASGRYLADAGLFAPRAQVEQAVLHSFVAEAHAQLPYAAGTADPFAGPVIVELKATALDLHTPDGGSTKLGIDARLRGDVSARKPVAFQGSGSAHINADEAMAKATILRRFSADVLSPRLVYGADGQIEAKLSLAAAAPMGEVQAAGEPVALSAIELKAAGRVLARGKGSQLDGSVSLAATGGLAPRRAERLAAFLAAGPYGDDLRSALARALGGASMTAPDIRIAERGDNWRLRLPAPVRVDTAGGGRLSLSDSGDGWTFTGKRKAVQGDGVVVLTGGGFPQTRLKATNVAISDRGARANVDGDLEGSFGPLKNLRLAVDGAVISHDGGVAFTLAQCAAVAFDRLLQDGKAAPLAERGAVQACPSQARALFEQDRSGWRTAVNLRALAVSAPESNVAVSGADIDIALSGRGRSRSGVATLRQASVSDTSAPLRFAPLRLSGPVKLRGDAATATLDVALDRSNRSIGRLQLAQDANAGSGELSFDTPMLVFAPQGLQPKAILPGLAGLGGDVSGPVQATLASNWRGPQSDTRLHLHLGGIGLKTAAGLLTGLRGDLTLTALDPLTSPPVQRLTADRLESVTPLTELSTTFSLGGGALSLASAQASIAGGRVTLDPMTVSLSPNASVNGVVRVDGLELGALLDALNLSRAVKIDAKLSGALPFGVGPQGLQIADGRLAAVGPGRLSLQRKGLTDLTANGEAAASSHSAAQDFAFQALENLAFTELDASVASRPQGRLGVVFHIKGRHDPPVATPARIKLMDLIRGRAFDKAIPLPKGTEINLTLDSSLNLADLLAAYPGLSRPGGSAQVQPQGAISTQH